MRNTRKNQRKKSHGSRAVILFWLIFVVVVSVVFLTKQETIKKNFNLFKTRITTSPGPEETLPQLDEDFTEAVIEEAPAVREPASPPAAAEPVKPPEPVAPKPPVLQNEPAKPQPPPQTRDRSVYFTQIDKDGQILRSRVTRKIPVSDSPMQDALNVLLAGPSADELNRGILNLIPQNTRLLSATVRGSTAYLSFSEDFLFNTFGVEGYAAQLRQIVWTVTEFSNVSDVQILVEGRRLDYLGEGIWIGSPIGRQSF